MKIVLAISVLFSASFVQAAEYHCSKQTSSTRRDSAIIKSGPNIEISVAYEDCPESGTVNSCAGGGTTLANSNSLCFKPVDLKTCKILSNSRHALEIRCPGGNGLVFDLDHNSMGILTCFEYNKSVNEIDVGSCIETSNI